MELQAECFPDDASPELIRRRQRPSRLGESGWELPEGWLKWWDDVSSSYYYENTATRSCQWEDPTRWWLGRLLERARARACAAPIEEARFESIEQAFAAWCDERFGDGMEPDDDEASHGASATLQVYDVKFLGSGVLNSVFLPLGLGGAFHTGISIHGREWSFGATEEGCGIFCCAPTRCVPHDYRESIPLGASIKTQLDVFNVLVKLAPLWTGDTYDVLRKNCNSFCIVLAGALGVAPPPVWIHTLGDGAADLDDRARRAVNSLRRPAMPSSRSLDDAVKAAVASDLHGRQWRVDFFPTYADAKLKYDGLSLSFASVLFVHFADEGAWHAAHAYGLQHAVHHIQRRFFADQRVCDDLQ